tara:strand:- start:1279 stop:1494 length:216 start_codon:yes stop_codon:yes gene_type:complete
METNNISQQFINALQNIYMERYDETNEHLAIPFEIVRAIVLLELDTQFTESASTEQQLSKIVEEYLNQEDN